MSDREILVSDEAGELMRCSATLVCEMARTGLIPATQIAGQWIFIRSQILEHLQRKAEEEQVKRLETARAVAALPASSGEGEKREPGRPRRKPPVDLSALLGSGGVVT